MSDPTPPTWLELLLLMTYGPGRLTGEDVPEPTVRGTVRSVGADEMPGNTTGWFASSPRERPAMTGAGVPESAAEVRVWRDGARVRVEADGAPSFVTDGETTWEFDDDGVPVASTGRQVSWSGRGTHLASRRDASDFLGDDFTRPTGPARPTTRLGRPAWAVELAPPPHKPFPLEVVVDAATGLVLEQSVDAVGAVDSWVELEIGEEIDLALFTWAGPVRSQDDERSSGRVEHETERATWMAWWSQRVEQRQCSAVVETELDLSPAWIHTYGDDGSFEAGLGEEQRASLARRPRSDEPWDLRWYGEPTPHLWSTARWDWAFRLLDAALTTGGCAAVERCFGDGEPGEG